MIISVKKRLLSLCAAAAMLAAAPCAAPAVSGEEFFRLNDSVTYEMTDAEFWIKNAYGDSDGGEKRIHSISSIEKINSQNVRTVGTENYTISLFDMEDTVDGDMVREIVDEVAAKPDDPSSCYKNGKPTTNAYWQKLEDNLNIDGIPDSVDVKFGYSVARSSLRTFPCADFIGEDKTDRFYDVLVMSEYIPFLPLACVHESADG